LIHTTESSFIPVGNILLTVALAHRKDTILTVERLASGFIPLHTGVAPALHHRSIHMPDPLILASQSEIRATLLRNAGLDFEVIPARIDETAILDALLSEGAPPRDIADTLAELKAVKVSSKRPDALVLGCDQVLDLGNSILMKPQTPDDAICQLRAMRGKTHKLLSAVVLYQDGKPLWRHVGQVRLTMHDVSDTWIDDYVARNWDSIRHSVGAYKLEEEGVRLFSRIEGDYFTVLGLPLLDLLSYLRLRGTLRS